MTVFLKDKVLEAVQEVKIILTDEINSEVFLESAGNSPAVKTVVQGIARKRNDVLINSILEIILTNALEAEKISPGGLKQTIKNFLNSSNEKILESSRSASSKDIKILINKICDDENLSSLVFSALQFAGFGGRISVEKSSSSVAYIEIKESYEFDAKSFEKSNVVLNSPYIVCIDGYVESVAEINRLLEDIVSTNRTTILLCRGYHNDVISTIKVNNVRGTFAVYPLIIPFDVENVNTMADIGVVLGKSPISSSLGQLITNVDKSEMVLVEEVKISNQKIYLKNSKTTGAVSVHVNNLIKKRSNSQGTEELLERRIKSLSCKNVTINLPEDYQKIQKTQKIDFCLRAIRSAISYGIIGDSELNGTKLASNFFAQKIEKSINNICCIIS